MMWALTNFVKPFGRINNFVNEVIRKTTNLEKMSFIINKVMRTVA